MDVAGRIENKRATSRGLALLIALIALIGIGKTIQADTMDPDAFWHLRVADQLRHDGIGPLVDRISFASEKTPWTPYSWLAELAMRDIWSIGGFAAAAVVTAVCSAAIIIFTALAASDLNDRPGTAEPLALPSPSRGEGNEFNPVAIAVVVAVAAFFTLPFISFRPVTFVLVVMAIVAWLMQRDLSQPSAATWLVVPLTLLATNLHLYAFIIAVMAVLLATGTWFDDRLQFRRRLLLAAACCAAVCCTPMLRGAIRTAINYNAVDPMVASPFITEMRPFYSGGIGKVSLVLFVTELLLCISYRRRLSMVDRLWFALGVILLLRLGRFSPIYAILSAPAVVAVMPALGSRVLARRPVQIAMLAVLILGATNVALALPWRESFDHWLNRNNLTYPTDAARFVDEHITRRTGKVINEFNWGGYLAWRLNDQQLNNQLPDIRWQVLMDGRTQLYSPAFWRATHLGTPQTRLDFLRPLDADAAVLPADGSCFEDPLTELGWTVAYRDPLAIVMVPHQSSLSR